MRFSLLTLVLITLWLSLAMLVWMRREPWKIESETKTSDEFRSRWIERFKQLPIGDAERNVSPDGTRYIYTPEGAYVEGPHIEIWDIRNKPLAYISMFDHFLVGFGDDDHILLGRSNDPSRYRIYARRFPEWWWGHLYRPEVWALIAISLILFGMLCRSRLFPALKARRISARGGAPRKAV